MAMTEEEWLVCSDPQQMLGLLGDKRIDRKLRLFAVACCRKTTHLLPPSVVSAIDIAERYADQEISVDALEAGRREACNAHMPSWPDNDAERLNKWRLVTSNIGADVTSPVTYVWMTGEPDGEKTKQVGEPLTSACVAAGLWAKEGHRFVDARCQAALLRCVLGPLPFRPVTINSSQKTSNAVALAESIYDRAFDRMPILADALEDAGCDNADILQHCRQPGEHVRGCWVVDLVLGRE
jgi:hypothetical protein